MQQIMFFWKKTLNYRGSSLVIAKEITEQGNLPNAFHCDSIDIIGSLKIQTTLNVVMII